MRLDKRILIPWIASRRQGDPKKAVLYLNRAGLPAIEHELPQFCAPQYMHAHYLQKSVYFSVKSNSPFWHEDWIGELQTKKAGSIHGIGSGKI
jgi:hypothetical protein